MTGKSTSFSFAGAEIPCLKELRQTIGMFRDTPIKWNRELSSEKVADIRHFNISGRNFYVSKQNPPYHEEIEGATDKLLLRISIIEKLKAVNARLLSLGLEVFVLDAFRPVAVQRYLYHEFLPRYFRFLQPESAEDRVMEMVKNFTAEPPRDGEQYNLDAPPPHATCAAVDLTLRTIETREWLYMGGLFDDPSELSYTDYFEHSFQKHRQQSLSGKEAQENRRLLYHVMLSEGFVNYPYEWWHYSWGDQMWGLQTGNPAFYSTPDFSSDEFANLV